MMKDDVEDEKMRMEDVMEYDIAGAIVAGWFGSANLCFVQAANARLQQQRWRGGGGGVCAVDARVARAAVKLLLQ
jgi:hypothetical protein